MAVLNLNICQKQVLCKNSRSFLILFWFSQWLGKVLDTHLTHTLQKTKVVDYIHFPNRKDTENTGPKGNDRHEKIKHTSL